MESQTENTPLQQPPERDITDGPFHSGSDDHEPSSPTNIQPRKQDTSSNDREPGSPANVQPRQQDTGSNDREPNSPSNVQQPEKQDTGPNSPSNVQQLERQDAGSNHRKPNSSSNVHQSEKQDTGSNDHEPSSPTNVRQPRQQDTRIDMEPPDSKDHGNAASPTHSKEEGDDDDDDGDDWSDSESEEDDDSNDNQSKKPQGVVAEVSEEMLATDPDQGLSESEAKNRQRKYGSNKLQEEKPHYFRKFLSYFWGPIMSLMEIAAILSAALQHWIDVGIIAALLTLNAIVGFFQEYQAGSTIEALKNTLALKAKGVRDGKIKEIEGSEIVPGDIIMLETGDIVPADCKIISEGAILQVDQSALTGESLAVRKGRGDRLFSSSVVKRGEAKAVVVATGDNTFVGKAASLVSSTKDSGHFTLVMNRIGYYLIACDFIAVCIIVISSFYRGVSIVQILVYAAILTIVAVPAALPTVITTTLAVGAALLAKKKAIVARLTAIESLASVDVLCSDKTGTLTKNKLSMHDPHIMEGSTTEELITAAYLASHVKKKGIDPIDKAIVKKVYREYKNLLLTIRSYKVVEFHPFDPVAKRILVELEHDGERFQASKGAPQVILQLAQQENPSLDNAKIDDYNQAINDLAKRGFRSLGVAWKRGDEPWEIKGVISLFDPPRNDTKVTIRQARELGLNIKMLTGDQLAIAKETARMLEMGTNIYNAIRLGLGNPSNESNEGGKDDHSTEEDQLTGPEVYDFVEAADGFAQVFPEHKYKVVEILQKRGHVVAMTGDGVNDAPSLKKANVGIAVQGASDAARSAASIVFLAPGLGVIIDAIKTSRQIFHRMQSYAQYRIALSMNLLLFIGLTITILNWTINTTLIVFLAIFSDIAVLTIAYDNSPFSPTPVTWNIRKLMISAVILGVVLAIGNWVLYTTSIVVPQYANVVEPMLFLEITLTQNWLILSTRSHGNSFFSPPYPTWPLLVAIFCVDILASVFAIFGWFTQPNGQVSNPRIDVVTAVRVWIFAACVFVVCDFVRMLLASISANSASWLVGTSTTAGKEPKDKRVKEDAEYVLVRMSTLHEKGMPVGSSNQPRKEKKPELEKDTKKSK
ncbi:hypothetical protein BC937DRAFT_95494 [Endogone sp. FLAS-F59071]|nr:hypothetical protein BC937DRAFT_95494 [Endogone sp. FLAS-F59071]|eukprot:RUS20315.1 hypothetical protein BC937DRAFT_95494 [Endogone sp. FLAS-F59071]